MKTLFIIRHAKTNPAAIGMKDFDRSLDDRGRKDAPAMANRLFKKNIQIDAFVSSPARRAKETATLFSEQYDRQPGEIIFKPELYDASYNIFYDVISGLDNALKHVAIFAHNPGITIFANTLTKAHIDHMPTCGVFALQIQDDNWNNFSTSEKNFWFFDYPKNIEK